MKKIQFFFEKNQYFYEKKFLEKEHIFVFSEKNNLKIFFFKKKYFFYIRKK